MKTTIVFCVLLTASFPSFSQYGVVAKEIESMIILANGTRLLLSSQEKDKKKVAAIDNSEFFKSSTTKKPDDMFMQARRRLSEGAAHNASENKVIRATNQPLMTK